MNKTLLATLALLVALSGNGAKAPKTVTFETETLTTETR